MSAEWKRTGDVGLLLTVLALMLFGLMMVSSASSVIAERFRDDTFFFLKHQLTFGVGVGSVAFLVGYFVPYRHWRYFALPGLMLSLVLLVLVFVPGLSLNYGDASRWIGIGPITIQPTEITKLAFILYLAALLERKGEDVRDFKKKRCSFSGDQWNYCRVNYSSA